ncbi:MAG TPA: hypothetical protein DCM45_05555 [Clostridiales bacterium]|nr:hypothetical protein [Clostridiales bacterium]
MKQSTVKLIIIAVIPFIMITAFIASIIWSGGHFFRYRSFKADYARSSAYAQQNNCLRADYDNMSIRVHPENAVRIYKLITAGGFILDDEVQAVGNAIVFDFGDGAVLQVWQAKPSGIQFTFVSDHGQAYEFTAEEISQFSTIERLSQLQGLSTPNELWLP